jgi:hypothetical protein
VTKNKEIVTVVYLTGVILILSSKEIFFACNNVKERDKKDEWKDRPHNPEVPLAVRDDPAWDNMPFSLFIYAHGGGTDCLQELSYWKQHLDGKMGGA